MAIKTVKDVVIIAEKEPRGTGEGGEWDEEGREDKQPKVGTMFQSNSRRGGGAHKRKNSRFIPPLSPLPLPASAAPIPTSSSSPAFRGNHREFR